jgi:osmotically-inducible protein OsmY
MSAFKRTHVLFALSAMLGGVGLAQAQESSQQPAPDNTKINERDRDKSEPTADQQQNNRSDLEITQQIRQAIMKDKTLSTYAHNVKVIAKDGSVTLKGPVKSMEEKTAIAAKAAEVVGAAKVTNDLDVKTTK